jgi:hypothetical protein
MTLNILAKAGPRARVPKVMSSEEYGVQMLRKFCSRVPHQLYGSTMAQERNQCARTAPAAGRQALTRNLVIAG